MTKERMKDDRNGKTSKPKIKAVISKEKPIPLSDVTVLSLDVGKASEVDRVMLTSHIISCSGINEDDIGRIGMGSNSSFVEISTKKASDVIKALNSSKLKGKRIRADYAPEKKRCKDKLKDKP